jgi:hypothetical protein
MAGKKLETELAEMLKERFRNRKIENVEEYVAKLKNARDIFDKAYDFKPGDLVVWKRGLKNKLRPALDEPAIVVQILQQPLRDEGKSDSGTAYFNEPLDLVLGMVDDDGDFILFHYDRRRFEPYQE